MTKKTEKVNESQFDFLKPCPFCGKNPQGPYHDNLGTDDDYYVIRCPGCQLIMYDEYIDYVIKNWNRRVGE